MGPPSSDSPSDAALALRTGKLFERLDLNGDGVISRDELRAGYLELIVRDLQDAATLYASGGGPTTPYDAASAAVATASDAVVVCGYGEMGQRVCDVLADAEGVGGGAGADQLRDVVTLPSGAWGTQFVAFDRNPSRVAIGLAKQMRVVYGDGASPELLKAAGLSTPRAIVVTYANDKRCLEATRRLSAAYVDTPIIVRSRTALTAASLLEAGATEVVVEAVEATLRVASLLGSATQSTNTQLRAPFTTPATAGARGEQPESGARGVADAALPPFPRTQLEALAVECGITLAQVCELYDGFAALQANSDGEVELSSLRTVLAAMGGVPIDEEALSAWMAEADADGNACLSFFEYVRVDTRLSEPGSTGAGSTLTASK